jgi:hypothetical protein
MNLENIIPADFPNESKVWIYQCNRPFNEQEVIELNEQLINFYTQWQSHGHDVKGWAQVIYNQFIVVMADENATGVSGCSTDSMVRIIKSFERQYQVELFDRLTITFLIKDKVEPLPFHQIKYALEKGFIETDTILFNNTIDTKTKLLHEWQIPLDKSWLWKRIVENV